MEHSRWTAGIAALLLLAGFMHGAMAASLQFNLTAAQTSGTISYDGGTGNPLVGIDIGIVDIIGLDTPANAGVTATCANCLLNFTTGNYTGFAGDTWNFLAGGSVSITGGIDFPDMTPDISAGSNLLTGTFTSAQLHDHIVTQPGEFHLHIDANTFTDSKLSALTDFYGLPGGEYTGAMVITFQTDTGISPGTAFTSNIINSGSVINQPVPVPAAVWLFGTGLLGLMGVARGRNTG